MEALTAGGAAALARAAATMAAESFSAMQPTSTSPTVTSALGAPSPINTGINTAPEVDNRNCRLLGPFALVVQALMGLFVVGSLVYKRQREQPRRKWKIWLLDISKQMTGQIYVHILNVVLSDAVAHHGKRNPCSLYFLNIIIDTTFGVLIIYVTLNALTHLFTEIWGYDGFVSGQYTPSAPQHGQTASNGEARGTRARVPRPKFIFWLRQLALYLVAITVMKLVVTALFWLFPFLIFFARWLIDLFGSHQKLQVFFVMAIVPVTMNTIQFWLIDSLLRHNPETSKYARVNTSEDGAEDGRDDSYDVRRSSATLERGDHSAGDEASAQDRIRQRNAAGHDSGRRIGSETFVLVEEGGEGGEDGSDPLTSPVKKGGHSRKKGSRGSRHDYGSTLKSPPLRPQMHTSSSLRSSMDDLRIEAASILAEGRPSSVRTSTESGPPSRPFSPARSTIRSKLSNGSSDVE